MYQLKEDGYNYLKYALYTEDIPRKIQTDFCAFSKDLEK